MPVEDLVPLFAALAEIEADVHTDLNVYEIRPRGQINLPAIYNWLDPSTMEPVDTAMDRDTVIVSVRIGVRHTDSGKEMLQLLGYADALRHAIDLALKDHTGPLGGVQARRLGMTPVQEEFGQIPVLAIEFPIRVRIERVNTPV